MIRLFLDSSALAKRYVKEVGTERVLELCRGAEEVVVSIIALPEVVSTLNRLRREGRLPQRDYDAIKQDVIADLAEATVIEATASILDKALACLERSPLRASDAVHIATAMEAGADLFLTADRRQRQGAIDAGLKVEAVGL